MSASPDDPQPVFDLIARRADELCDGAGVAVFEFDGKLVHFRAVTDITVDPEASARYSGDVSDGADQGINCLSGNSGEAGQSMFRTIRATRSWTRSPKRSAGSGQSSVPLLRDGVPIGAIDAGNRTGRFYRQPDRAAADLRRAGGDRHQQRRDVSRVAGTHRGAGRAQQRIRRADRTAGRDHRRAEGHVGLARRCATRVRADRRAGPLLLWCRPRNDGAAAG